VADRTHEPVGQNTKVQTTTILAVVPSPGAMGARRAAIRGAMARPAGPEDGFGAPGEVWGGCRRGLVWGITEQVA
jgi:hypothetical protein